MDVYGRELRIVNGAYKPDNNWGGPHGIITEKQYGTGVAMV